MSKPPRRHHFISKFQLTSFTPTGSRHDRLWVTDQKSGKRWQSLIDNIAFEKDLYRIEVGEKEGLEPDILESKIFSDIETNVSRIIKTIETTLQLPDGEDFFKLIDFIALLFCKNPTHRKLTSKPLEDLNKMILKEITSSRERWESIQARMRKDGYTIDEDYEGFKEFVESDNYTIQISQNYLIQLMLYSYKVLTPTLLRRKWSLAIAPDESGGFICSDNPVSLVWTKPIPDFWSPGFGMTNTELTVPLTRNFALVSRFEGQSEQGFATLKTIASINSRTGMYSDRFVYSAWENFLWVNNSGSVCNSHDLIAAIKNNNNS